MSMWGAVMLLLGVIGLVLLASCRTSPGRFARRTPGRPTQAPSDTSDSSVTPPRAMPRTAPVLEGGSSAGRALWRLPPRSGQSGVAVDAARVGDLDVRAASVIGPAHRCVEPAAVRQDAYALGLDAAQAHLVIAVADGLSSSAHADVGARAAVSTAVRELILTLDGARDLDAIDVQTLFRTVAGEIVGTGRERGLAEQELCCLLVVAVVPSAAAPDGSRQVWTAQLGDVSVWTQGERWQQQTGPFKSGLDRNAVEAVLPFHPDQVATSWVTVPPGAGVAVMTDGVGDLLNDVVAASGFFAEQWEAAPLPAAFLLDLCVDAPGQDDDRTAVVVWCGSADHRAAGAAS